MPPRLIAVLAAIVVLATTVAGQSSTAFDLLISGGRVVDGTGAPWFRGDVGVKGDRIAAIGRLDGASARTRIDASGLVVSPGFIDMLGQSEFNLLVDNRAASKLMQGVTTELTGEGSSIGPLNDRVHHDDLPTYEHFHVVADWATLGEYLTRLDRRVHPGINLGSFVGAGGLRTYVMGKDDRPATATELTQMTQLAAAAMEQGAFGLSSALQYVPDRFATTDELVALARVAAQHGGIYITHQRSESGRIFESIDEVTAIAERAGIPAEIFHLKTAYAANWGKMPQVLERLRAARSRGVDITADQYPYARASNGLDACLPLWVREGGTDKMIARLRDPLQRERVRAEMADANATEWENQWIGSGGADGVMIAAVINPELKKYEGETLAEVGTSMGKDPRDAVMDLVLADRGQTQVIISIMNEDDVRTALSDPLVAVGTDSPAMAEDGPLSHSKSHPRGWGSFPRILGKYVRDEHLLTLEEAIRKMTSRPAARVGLPARGVLRPGMFADITIFDPQTIHDVATFADPNHYAVGVQWVLVNGRVAVANGRLTAERAGRALRGPGWKKS
jgi:dihydroorotase/N-acyl-D-amino-acid deacylase